MASLSSDSSTTTASWTRKPRALAWAGALSLGLLGLASPSLASLKQADIMGRPIVEGDRVTLRVKVKDSLDRPAIALNEGNFKLMVDEKPVSFAPKDWKSPKESVPPPAWVVVLIDMSGSMRNPDARGKTKIKGALEAIEQFNQTLMSRSQNLPLDKIPQLAIVPFGEGDSKPEGSCKGFPVDRDSLENFFPVTDVKLSLHLEHLAKLKPCASTNLYEPLSKAIRLLGNTKDPRFYSADVEVDQQPRLSIILLSDGYQNTQNEQTAFDDLKSLIKRNPQVMVHTLGYGLTPEELGKKYGLNRPATRQDLWSGCGGDPKKVETGKVCDEEFVDQTRLQEIAQLSGGIGEFSADAQAVADKLDLFLDALIGEYEITFTQPSSERASKHEVKVVVQADQTPITSPPQPYTITVFGRTVPLSLRLGMLSGIALVLAAGGALPFWMWSKALKQEA